MIELGEVVYSNATGDKLYFFKPPAQGRGFTYIAISKHERTRLENLFETFNLLLTLEEHLEVIFLALKGYEMKLFETSLNYAVSSRWPDISRAHEEKYKIFGQLANVLTNIHTYLDYTGKTANKVPGLGKDQFEKIRRAVHSKSLSYRVGYALRNHVQHQGFSGLSISYQGRNHGDLPSYRRIKISAKRDVIEWYKNDSDQLPGSFHSPLFSEDMLQPLRQYIMT